MVTEHRDHVLAIAALLAQRLQLAHVVVVIEEGVLTIPLIDDPAPRSPAPDGEGGGEEVVVRTIRRHLVDVEA